MRALSGFSNWSLRRKLVSIIMLSCAACLFVSLSVMMVSSAFKQYRNALQELSGLADVLAENGQAALAFADHAEARRLLESLREHQEILASWMISADGQVLSSWSRTDIAPATPDDFQRPFRELRTDFWSRRAELFTPVIKNGELIGYVLLQADFTAQWNDQLAGLGKSLIAAGLALILVYLLANRLQGIISGPIEELAVAARNIGNQKDYGLRVKPRGHDEIGDLVRAFNAMLTEIQLRDENLIRHRDRLEQEVAQRTTEYLQAKEEAEAAARSKGLFLANMSHEIRTPMNAIVGLSDLALNTNPPPKLLDYLRKIHTSSMALMAITNDILDYSKVEAGRMELVHEVFSLEEMLENVLNLFVVRAEEKGLEVVLELDPNLPSRLIGDALRLGQVLNNLVGNAVKFTDIGEIHLKVEQLATAHGFTTLKFSVRDSGIGMTPAQLEHLFQAFSQADSSITRRFGGTGLGLTISKSLIEMMGGELSVQSQPGQGSVFEFSLLLPLPEEVGAGHANAQLHSMRVLIVDDLDISRQILRDIMQAWGFQVVEAANGEAALAELKAANDQSQDFELVLLDWKMPGLDGVEVTRAIKDMVRKAEIRHAPVIIMVTAFSREKLLSAAGEAKPDDILVKPVMPSVLLNTLTRLQGGETFHVAEQDRPELSAMAAAIRGAHILLVEDNEINQLVAREYLESAGLIVTVANNGREGVEAVRQTRFDAVLMDLQMPELDGVAATRIIRQDKQFADLPIIAMTAAVQDKERNDCRAAGMNDHLAKPVLPQTLIEVLIRCIKPHAKTAQPAPAAKTSPDKLFFPAELPGFDLDYIRKTIGLNAVKFKRLLDNFCDKFADSAARLSQPGISENADSAARWLHDLKGAAGVIGATELSRAAARLEESVAAGAPAEIDTAALTQALENLRQTAALFGDSSNSPEYAAADWAVANNFVRHLRMLLEGNDFVPHELINALKDALPSQNLQPLLLKFEKQINTIDYRQAEKTLVQLDAIISQYLQTGPA
ncbi:response regulator [Methylomonas sp. SURF-2]|uniref:histidine kinase n=1 Tax=Methylomonas subterranea TaxID=2952225 RepID=A0ABT1TKY2_9GAMM|nr:response regulator [Methylomonas sp. SURF-2]MCQ8105873.1 response regulator [Methylomonas sp. SURF-2]